VARYVDRMMGKVHPGFLFVGEILVGQYVERIVGKVQWAPSCTSEIAGVDQLRRWWAGYSEVLIYEGCQLSSALVCAYVRGRFTITKILVA
jgi:hypothetical protein